MNPGFRVPRLYDHPCLSEQLRDALFKFVIWLDEVGYESYDPYDIWGTKYGLEARRLYYQKHPLGLILTGPLILMDMICPSLRALFVTKARFATADAQLLLAFLNLYEITRDTEDRRHYKNGRHLQLRQNTKAYNSIVCSEAVTNKYESSSDWLTKAQKLAEDLLAYKTLTKNGYGWGYPFDWQNVNGFTKKGTPHIASTPYCYEAFVRLFEVTEKSYYLEIARSIASFFFSDLNDIPTGKDSVAGSYTPFDCEKVINASAYRVFVLLDAARRFNYGDYQEKGLKNLRFILQSQEKDGSWLYAIDNPKEAFIDHFHTCFVLKNLIKLNRHINNELVTEAIRKGYKYYRQALFAEDDNPKSFAIAPRMQLIKLEMYNVAEAITLGSLLTNEFPEAFSLARKLVERLITHHQLPTGHFITRIYKGGLKHKLPFLRWPQAQLFYSMTNFLLASLPAKNEDSFCR